MIRAGLPAVALATALLLSGCGTADPGIAAATSLTLQREVRDVARLASAHRYPAALTAAATLRTHLRSAVGAGDVTADRAKRIRSALALVETDLRIARSAASPSPSPSATRASTATPTPTRIATPKPISTPTATPSGASKKAAEAVQKAIDAAKRAVEQPQRSWKGKGRHKKDGGD